MLPVDGLTSYGFVVKGRNQAPALHGCDLLALVFRGIHGPCHIHTGGHDVNQVSGLMTELAPGLDVRGPVRDQGSRDSAFVDPVLVQPEWCVGHVGPVSAIAYIRIGRSRHDLGAAPHSPAVACLHGGPDIGLKVIRCHGVVVLDLPHPILIDVLVPAHALCTPAVVLKEQYQGVLENPLLLQL